MTASRRALPNAASVAALLALAAASPAHARSTTRFACPASESLTVHRDGVTAYVQLAGQTYQLKRKQSSIGDKYISANAALIIDGDSAVFVADRVLDLGTCIETVPIAKR